MAFLKGYVMSEEHKRKIGKANKGKPMSEEQKEKLRLANIGKHHSEEHKRKISNSNLGKHKEPHTEETKKKMSLAHKGLPSTMKGKHHTEEANEKNRQAHIGKKHSEETKLKMSELHKGEKCHLWKGGISYEPYSMDWTKTLKRAIRERDNYTCQMCGKLQSERAFDVHHIDGDKKNCNPDNLVTLCHNCHAKLINGNLIGE